MKITINKKNEDLDAAKVFKRRHEEALDRCDYLKGIIAKFNPEESDIDRDTVSRLDYILESLDNVIKDAKDKVDVH